eukprot:3945498-Pleurochrysis_carterae.AAC.1
MACVRATLRSVGVLKRDDLEWKLITTDIPDKPTIVHVPDNPWQTSYGYPKYIVGMTSGLSGTKRTPKGRQATHNVVGMDL